MPVSVRRILALSLAGGVLFDVLVPGNAAGLNAVVVVAAFLVAALLAAGMDGIRRMDPADGWLAPAAIVFAALVAVRADDWLVAADLLIAAGLAAAVAACLAGGRITRGLVPRILELAVGTTLAGMAGAASLLLTPRLAQVPTGHGAPSLATRFGARLRPAVPILRGLLIAVPVVVVFATLFVSADAVFARLVSEVFDWQLDVDLEDVAVRAFVVSVVAWGAAGLLGFGAGMLPSLVPVAVGHAGGSAPARQIVGPDGPAVTAGGRLEPPAPPRGSGWGAAWPDRSATETAGPMNVSGARPVAVSSLRLGSTEAVTLLVVVDILFALFVVVQLAYLFGGRDTMTLAGLTYAEYARRGFFELVIVAMLAGGLVVILDLAVATRSRGQLASALALFGLTVVILVSAVLRLRLYQAMYGWTELRFVVLVAIISLAFALAIASGLLATRRTQWVLHALGILALVTIAGMNVVGPQSFVADRNLERAIDPSLVPSGGRTGLDADYLRQLGDEAVVPVVGAWDRLGQVDRDALAPALEWRRETLATDPSFRGWPAWNLTRERARSSLASWEADGP